MPAARKFTELKFWQKARQWSKRIFDLTQTEPFAKDHRLVTQINDSSESVMSNIAEGFGRGTQGEFVTFLGYAIGSLDETQSHLCAAYDRKYISKNEFAELFQEGIEIRKMTTAFITSMVMPGSGAKHLRKQPKWSDQVWEIYERVTGQKRPELFQRPQQSDEE
jgi:four helix bundle protein